MLTADSLVIVFGTQMSEASSNKWEKEGQIIALWMDYVQDSEGRTHKILSFYCHIELIFFMFKKATLPQTLKYSIICNWMYSHSSFRVQS